MVASCYLACPSELLHVSHYLQCFLADSHCFSNPMLLLHLSHCQLWLLDVSNCLSSPMELLHVSNRLSLTIESHGFAACL